MQVEVGMNNYLNRSHITGPKERHVQRLSASTAIGLMKPHATPSASNLGGKEREV